MPIAFIGKKLMRVFGRKDLPSPFRTLANEETLQEALVRSESEAVVLFKHSSACGISFMARRQMERLCDESEPPVYELVVQHSRALSNRVADLFGIRHQSPQAIIVYRSRPVFNASHGNITAERIREALGEATRPPTSDS